MDTLNIKITLNPFALKLLKPVWFFQVVFGFKPWTPKWLFSIGEIKNGTNT